MRGLGPASALLGSQIAKDVLSRVTEPVKGAACPYARFPHARKRLLREEQQLEGRTDGDEVWQWAPFGTTHCAGHSHCSALLCTVTAVGAVQGRRRFTVSCSGTQSRIAGPCRAERFLRCMHSWRCHHGDHHHVDQAALACASTSCIPPTHPSSQPVQRVLLRRFNITHPAQTVFPTSRKSTHPARRASRPRSLRA